LGSFGVLLELLIYLFMFLFIHCTKYRSAQQTVKLLLVPVLFEVKFIEFTTNSSSRNWVLLCHACFNMLALV